MRVLVVDDEPDIREALRDILVAALDADVATARDGVQALEALRDSAFDALVTDERMPNMRGSELLRAIGDRGPPVRVLMTAYAQGPELAESCGATHFVPKPLDFAMLRRILQGAA